MILPSALKAAYDRDGYVIARSLFSAAEAQSYLDHYMALRQRGEHAGDSAGVANPEGDPLLHWPRMIQMHRWDDRSLDWLLEPRLAAVLTQLIGVEPYAAQTMLYFKPPGARGQALHQDQFYLRVQPGTCMAAWMALDRCDEANGCMMVVPGSHTWPVLCTTAADTKESFTDVTVPLPEGTEAVPVVMEPGDVLFFNGQVIHGSLPNVTTDRFRRALIGHYVAAEAQAVASFYQPTLRMDGSIVDLDLSQGGGPCGVWVDRDGAPAIVLAEPPERLVPSEGAAA